LVEPVVCEVAEAMSPTDRRTVVRGRPFLQADAREHHRLTGRYLLAEIKFVTDSVAQFTNEELVALAS
jgi:hypothetical protein